MIKLKDLIDDVMREAKGTDPFADDQLPKEDPELEEGAQACYNCRWFIKDISKCDLLTPSEVLPQGMCDLWAQGDPATADQLSPRQIVEKRDANYTDDYHKHPFNLDNPSG